MNFALLLFSTFLVQQTPVEEAQRVERILRENCHRCHGLDGANEGGFSSVLNRDRIVDTKRIMPGEPAKSKLFQRITNAGDPMPPDGEKPRPSADDIATIKRWIESGAPSWSSKTAERAFVSPQAMIELMARDVALAPAVDRPYLRYFTLTNLANAGIGDEELESYRVGLSKLINSLSWGAKVVKPVSVDPARTILRIDMRHYRWTDSIWDEILLRNSLGIEYRTPAEKELRSATRSRVPHVRADWFVHAASRPPLYHAILDLPLTDRLLEKQLKVDVIENIRTGRVARAGFNGSGVSRNNRLIERHESGYGAYWKSYDFAGNSGDKSLFVRPFGPGDANNNTVFHHDGGEIIFNLPNGLQAYLLVDGAGNRIDKGPVQIVSDPRQPDRQVVNGLSCMSCHSRGMLEKDDQVRRHVLENPGGFTPTERKRALEQYPPREDMLNLIRSDATRFKDAVAATGAPLSSTEPVAALARRFDEELDLKMLAAEFGLTPEALIQRLDAVPALARLLGSVRVAGGTVQREIIVEQAIRFIEDIGSGHAIPQCRAQRVVSLPTQTAPEKTAEDYGAVFLSFPDASASKGKSATFRRFLDKANKQWIYVTAAGHMAMLPFKSVGASHDLKNSYYADFEPRSASGEPKPAKQTLLAAHDLLTGGVIYVNDQGGIAAVHAAAPTGTLKHVRRIATLNYSQRKAGEPYLQSEIVHRLLEVHDENNGMNILLSANGAMTADRLRPDVRRSRTPHGYSLPARRHSESLANFETRQAAVDVREVPGVRLALFTGDRGSLALVPTAISANPTLAPVHLNRLRLTVTGTPLQPPVDSDKSRSIEIYRDPNTGCLLYVGESGHFAATKP